MTTVARDQLFCDSIIMPFAVLVVVGVVGGVRLCASSRAAGWWPPPPPRPPGAWRTGSKKYAARFHKMERRSCSPSTHYEILGVSQVASLDEIKTAYRSSALTHHPDRAKTIELDGKASEAAFIACQRAWEVLQDPLKRSNYDQFLSRRTAEETKSALVDEEIAVTDLYFDHAAGMYWYPCRCGDKYELSDEELSEGSCTLECMSCSFSMYLDVPDDYCTKE